MPDFRSLLVLGRVSNLSTVWGNGVCAWAIAGGGDWRLLLLALFGVSCLYLAGMYFNDWWDVDFDKAFRPERPIPAGKVSRGFVLGAVLLYLVVGLAAIGWANVPSLVYGAVLVGLIFLYTAIHKKSAWGVPVMAGCRVMVYPLAASVAIGGVSFWVWGAGALMFFYVMGITALARGESREAGGAGLGMGLLLAPLFVAAGYGVVVGETAFLKATSGGTALLGALWVLRCRVNAADDGKLVVGKMIGPLLAGICLVDLAVLSGMGRFGWEVAALMLGFFGVALLAQKKVPAS